MLVAFATKKSLNGKKTDKGFVYHLVEETSLIAEINIEKILFHPEIHRGHHYLKSDPIIYNI